MIAGGSTDVGVASTAFAARDIDYHLVIVSDACTSAETDNHTQFMQRVFPAWPVCERRTRCWSCCNGPR